MKFEVECLETFKDGNIFDRTIGIGERLVVKPGKYKQMKQSGPTAWRKIGAITGNTCPDCGFEAKSEAGLATHMRYCED